jgi:cytochrome oxidase Cu insertion factor (SCO1/SenC/PrrC family)
MLRALPGRQATPAVLFVAAALSLPVGAQYSRPAGDAEVLDEAGYFRTLAEFTQGRVTLLALAYARCADEQGCGRATAALRETRALLRAEPLLQKRVRLVTLSIDPAHDLPRPLAAFAAHARGDAPGADWSFVTTLSPRRLSLILSGLDSRLPVPGAFDDPATLPEYLGVYLLDTQGNVRQTYAIASAAARAILADIRALDREQRLPPPTLLSASREAIRSPR